MYEEDELPKFDSDDRDLEDFCDEYLE